MKADKYIRETGPVGNGYARIYDEKTGREGYKDSYGNVILDPEPERDPLDDPKFKKQLQDLKSQSNTFQTGGAPPASAPQADPGLGALPLIAGIFAGISLAEANRSKRRQQPIYPPPPAHTRKEEKDIGLLASICYIIILVLFVRIIIVGILTLFFHFGLLRFLLNLAVWFVCTIGLSWLAGKLEK